MKHISLEEAEDKFGIPKRGSSEPKKTYLTPGYGYEEDRDLLLEGKTCKCGGTLQHQRRHESNGTRQSQMIGGPGKYTEITYKRVETVVCVKCGSLHDLGIYDAWKEERRRSNPLTFFPDDLRDTKPDSTPSITPENQGGRRRTDSGPRYRVLVSELGQNPS